MSVEPLGVVPGNAAPAPRAETAAPRSSSSGARSGQVATTKPAGKGKAIAGMQYQLYEFHTRMNNAINTASNEFLTTLLGKSMKSGVKSATSQALDMGNFATSVQSFTKKHADKFDGSWDQTTDDALRAAWVQASAMLSVAQKLGHKLEFDTGDLAMFRKLIPDTYSDTVRMTSGNLVWRAKRIAPFLYRMRKSIGEFVNTAIDESHKYAPHTSGKPFEALETRKFDPSTQLTKEEEGLAQSEKEILDVATPDVPITFKDLSSLDNFRLYLQRSKKPFDGDNLREQLNYIQQNIGERVKTLREEVKPTFERQSPWEVAQKRIER